MIEEKSLLSENSNTVEQVPPCPDCEKRSGKRTTGSHWVCAEHMTGYWQQLEERRQRKAGR